MAVSQLGCLTQPIAVGWGEQRFRTYRQAGFLETKTSSVEEEGFSVAQDGSEVGRL